MGRKFYDEEPRDRRGLTTGYRLQGMGKEAFDPRRRAPRPAPALTLTVLVAAATATWASQIPREGNLLSDKNAGPKSARALGGGHAKKAPVQVTARDPRKQKDLLVRLWNTCCHDVSTAPAMQPGKDCASQTWWKKSMETQDSRGEQTEGHFSSGSCSSCKQ